LSSPREASGPRTTVRPSHPPPNTHTLTPRADITYASLARAFGQRLAHHAETLSRMRTTFAHRQWLHDTTHAQEEATRRMALFPERAEVLFVQKDMWVVSRVPSSLLT
jgi:molybdopterin-biosynthesis enzyme MoeA-like protein